MKYIAVEDLNLLEALTRLAPESSKTTLRSWLKDGRITVNAETIKLAAFRVKKGQEVELGTRQRFTKNGIKIYYEDRHIVVVEKPDGLLSVSTAFQKNETLHAYLKERYHPQPVYVVHRLDQDTSGVMLFALSEEARDKLKLTFEKHDIERGYYAIVEGKPVEQDSGTWQSYVYEDDNYVVHNTPDPEKGSLAVTHFEVHNKSRRYTALILKLETGRKNQIRVHCQTAGNPVVGDKKYGASTSPIKRLCLHAFLLAFQHPITQKPMRFESPIPESFTRLIPKLTFDN